MVATANEIQSVRMQSRIFELGDYAAFESPFIPQGAITAIDDRSVGVPQDNALYWIPQLHQIMALIGGYHHTLDILRAALGGGAPKGYLEGLSSWEECALALLMWKRFNRVWQGQGWIRTP